MYLSTRGDGPNVFYFSNFGVKDGEQITRSWSSKKDWEVVVKVSDDGKKILGIQCFWDDRKKSQTFTSIADFESAAASNRITVSR